MSKHDVDTLDELVAESVEHKHMTITMPESIKKELVALCEEKGLKMKDVVIWSIKQTLKKYGRVDGVKVSGVSSEKTAHA